MVELSAFRIAGPALWAREHLRGPQGHAAALGVLLVPAAVLASHRLADHGAAEFPLLAAFATGMICVIGGALVFRGLSPASYPHQRLGLCNRVTMLRASGIAVLAGLAIAPATLAQSAEIGWAITALAAIVLVLDGVDGWAARRAGLRSDFGARFDVETDVVFAIVMAVLAWQAGKVGIWFLALGGLRPAFLLAGYLWPELRAQLPEAFWRKAMAAAQMTLQVVLIAPIVVPPASQILGALVLGALMLSFAVDIRWLLRRAGKAPQDSPTAVR